MKTSLLFFSGRFLMQSHVSPLKSIGKRVQNFTQYVQKHINMSTKCIIRIFWSLTYCLVTKLSRRMRPLCIRYAIEIFHVKISEISENARWNCNPWVQTLGSSTSTEKINIARKYRYKFKARMFYHLQKPLIKFKK